MPCTDQAGTLVEVMLSKKLPIPALSVILGGSKIPRQTHKPQISYCTSENGPFQAWTGKT